MRRQDLRLQQLALEKWLRQAASEGVAATLTFKQRLDGKPLTRDIAQATITHYLHRLDRIAFGRRNKSQVSAIAVREGGTLPHQKHLHYHLALPTPPNYSAEDWRSYVLRTWPVLDWASPIQNRFELIRDSGWLSYMLKLRDKSDFLEAMDFENFRLN